MTATRAFLMFALVAASASPAMAQTRPSHGASIAPADDHAGHRNRVPEVWRDGIVVNQFDNQTLWSDGRSATQFGSIVIYNDGTLATQSGERTIFGNGRSCTQFGATTICD
ncbi:MAG: hypothetical protein K0Q70_1374 [Rhodospirillales bacterium]|jgi:hypothetical protein|nr:hypothetical protein [Rhodospirillales bacterium]